MNFLMVDLDVCTSERLNEYVDDILKNKISALHLSSVSDKNREGIVKLFEAIKRNTSISYLSFNAEAEAEQYYIGAMGSLSFQARLDAHTKNLVNQYAELLSYMLKHSTSLKCITIKYAKLDIELFNNIMESLKVNTSLIFFDMHEDYFGDNYIISIADMLSCNTTLQKIKLSYLNDDDLESKYAPLERVIQFYNSTLIECKIYRTNKCGRCGVPVEIFNIFKKPY